MKILLFRVSVFLLLLLVLSCQNKDSEGESKEIAVLKKLEKQKIIIHGQTDYYNEIYPLYFTSKHKSEQIIFDSLQFRYELESDFPVIVKISNARHRNIPIFAMPGDSIKLDFILTDFLNEKHTQKFSGSSISENQLLSALDEKLILDNFGYFYLYDEKESNFLVQMDSLEKVGLDLKKQLYPTNSNMNPYFDFCYDTFLTYKIAEFIGNYPRVNKSRNGKKDMVLSEQYHKKYNSFFVENSDLLNVYPYSQYLSSISNAHCSDFLKQNPNTIKSGFQIDPAINFYLIDSIYQNQAIIDHQCFLVMERIIDFFQYRTKLAKSQPIIESKTPKIGATQNNFTDFIPNVKKDFKAYQDTKPPLEFSRIVDRHYEEAFTEE